MTHPNREKALKSFDSSVVLGSESEESSAPRYEGRPHAYGATRRQGFGLLCFRFVADGNRDRVHRVTLAKVALVSADFGAHVDLNESRSFPLHG
jgi:hypothetical protein